MCVLTAASEPHNLQAPFNAYAFLPITHSNSYAAVEWYTVLHIHVWPLPQGKGVRRICNAVFLYISFSGRRISGETLSVNGCEVREIFILLLGTAVRFCRWFPKIWGFASRFQCLSPSQSRSCWTCFASFWSISRQWKELRTLTSTNGKITDRRHFSLSRAGLLVEVIYTYRSVTFSKCRSSF